MYFKVCKDDYYSNGHSNTQYDVTDTWLKFITLGNRVPIAIKVVFAYIKAHSECLALILNIVLDY